MSDDLTRRNFLKEATLLAGGLAVGTVGLAGCSSGQEGDTPVTDEGTTAAGATTENGLHYRPARNSGEHPLPMQTGSIGTEAQPIPPEPVPASWDEEFDVVVVGSGYGGLSASTIGATNQLKIALIEKGDTTGGASRHAAGNTIAAGGSKAQEEYGYHWPGDTFDPMAAAAQYQSYCQWTIDDDLLLATIDQGKDWADWMTDLPGMDWVCMGRGFRDRPLVEGTRNAVLGNTRIVDALEDNALKAGVDIKLKTECKALVQDGDRIVGVKISDRDGNETFLKANKAVLLTAGGFGMNLDLLEQYTPTAYMFATQGGPMPSHTGECFRMGLGVGADVSGYNSFSCWEGGLDEFWGNGDGEYFHYFWHGEKQVIQNPWLKIDKNGNRLEFFTLHFADGFVQENWTI
jgi:hypothetical protein